MGQRPCYAVSRKEREIRGHETVIRRNPLTGIAKKPNVDRQIQVAQVLHVDTPTGVVVRRKKESTPGGSGGGGTNDLRLYRCRRIPHNMLAREPGSKCWTRKGGEGVGENLEGFARRFFNMASLLGNQGVKRGES